MYISTLEPYAGSKKRATEEKRLIKVHPQFLQLWHQELSNFQGKFQPEEKHIMVQIMVLFFEWTPQE